MELKGQKACKGIVTGKVFLVRPDHESRINEFIAGDILVAYRTTPDFTHVFGLASGIVTQIGGVLSHAAIVSREYGVPCIVGVKDLLSYLKDGQEITLNADNGTITYESMVTQKPTSLIIEECSYCNTIGHLVQNCDDCELCDDCSEYVSKEGHDCPWCNYCDTSGHTTDDCDNCKYCFDCEGYVDNDHEHAFEPEEA